MAQSPALPRQLAHAQRSRLRCGAAELGVLAVPIASRARCSATVSAPVTWICDVRNEPVLRRHRPEARSLAHARDHRDVEYCTRSPRIRVTPTPASSCSRFSGSHQDAIRKCLVKQEAGRRSLGGSVFADRSARPWRRYEEVIRINSQSGKGGVLHVLERDLGITLRAGCRSISRAGPDPRRATGRRGLTCSIHALFNSTYVSARMLAARRIRRAQDRRRRAHDGHARRRHTHDRLGRGTVAALATRWQSLGVSITVEAFDEMALDARNRRARDGVPAAA